MLSYHGKCNNMSCQTMATYIIVCHVKSYALTSCINLNITIISHTPIHILYHSYLEDLQCIDYSLY
jgi:hypothetical protein